MKKIFLTSALAISMIVPAMAETTAPDIAAGAESASCDSGTLNTTDGTSTLSAQWTANTINLTWYNGDTTYATNTCTYDGGITLPSGAPTRTGYNFAGWQVKQALFDLSTLDVNKEITYFVSNALNQERCEGWDTSIDGEWFGADEGDADCSDSRFSHLATGEWSVTAEYGTVKGMARCSTTPGTNYAETGNPADSGGGQYCWCQATGYATSGSNSFANVSSPSWVFDSDLGHADDCANFCANRCADFVQFYSDFRSAVFGVSGN